MEEIHALISQDGYQIDPEAIAAAIIRRLQERRGDQTHAVTGD